MPSPEFATFTHPPETSIIPVDLGCAVGTQIIITGGVTLLCILAAIGFLISGNGALGFLFIILALAFFFGGLYFGGSGY